MKLDRRIARARVKFFFVFGLAVGFVIKIPTMGMFCAMMGIIMPMAMVVALYEARYGDG